MPIKNETLRKKLLIKQSALASKIAPLAEELEMIDGMLQQLDKYEEKSVKAAETQLGLIEEA